MSIDIDQLSYEELVDLNHRIVERLKFLDHMHAHSAMLQFRIGERVAFDSQGRGTITGVLTKYNRKTVNVVTDEGQHWRVAPSLLRKANSSSTHVDSEVRLLEKRD